MHRYSPLAIFTTVHLLNLKAMAAQALTEFADNVGIPDTLLPDGAVEVSSQHADFMKEVNRMIRLRHFDAGRSNETEFGNWRAQETVEKPDAEAQSASPTVGI